MIFGDGHALGLRNVVLRVGRRIAQIDEAEVGARLDDPVGELGRRGGTLATIDHSESKLTAAGEALQGARGTRPADAVGHGERGEEHR